MWLGTTTVVVPRYNPIGLKGRYNMKKYADYTPEEKQQYKEKREAYWKKREETAYNSYIQLKEELEKLQASETIMSLLDTMVKSSGIVKGGGSGTSSRETYLTAIFGTENPEIGKTVTFQYVGIRGPNGERLKDNETLAQFVTRVGDISYKYDKTSIGQMLWYLKKRGYNVTKNDDNATVTFHG